MQRGLGGEGMTSEEEQRCINALSELHDFNKEIFALKVAVHKNMPYYHQWDADKILAIVDSIQEEESLILSNIEKLKHELKGW